MTIRGMIGVSLSLLAAPLTSQDPSSASRPPNFVFILADDLGYGDLGSYGQQHVHTPRLDRMAAEGLRFTQFYAGSTVCAPSRCALMTGRHTGHCRIRGNRRLDLRDEDVTVAEILRAAGYATALFGKWGLGAEGSDGVPTRQGFDEFFGYLDQRHAHNFYPEWLIRNEERVRLENVTPNADAVGAGVATVRRVYSHDLFVDAALDFLDQRQAEPFFLYLALTIPHANNEAGPRGMEVPDLGEYADRDWPEPRKGHAAMVSRMDRDVGRILDRLHDLGIAENTLVVFTSDNGPHREGGYDPRPNDSNGPLRGIKRSLHDGGIRVPTIAWWPGTIDGGRTTDWVGAFQDVMPTFAELAGASDQVPDDCDGISFVPTLRGSGEQPEHESLYWAFFERGAGQAVRFGDWKAVQQPFDGPLRLYDLDTDIGERNDVAATHPDVTARARRLMRAEFTSSPHWRFPARAPNVVFLLVDDMGWRDPSFMGGAFHDTPAMDRLAAEGMTFTNAYANAPNCAPSRACIMSGQYTPRHGVYTVGNPARGKKQFRKLIPTPNKTELDDGVFTLAEMLQDEGYTCGHFGKWHLGDDPKTQGFDVNVAGNKAGHPKSYFSPYGNADLADGPKGENLTDRLGDEAVQFIGDNAHRRFFVHMSFYAVHTPLQAKQDLADKYRARDKTDNHGNARFAAMIETVDHNIAKILGALETHGLTEDTVVILFSDNGGVGGITSMAPLRGAKGMLYEGGIREPLVVRWPGRVASGSTCDVPVAGIDFYPTFIELAQAKPSDDLTLDGVSIVPLLDGGDTLERRALYWHFPAYLQAGRNAPSPFRTTPAGAVRAGRHKLIEYFEDGRLELYDLSRDASESDDLAGEQPEIVADLHRLLRAWRESLGAPVPSQPNPAFDPDAVWNR